MQSLLIWAEDEHEQFLVRIDLNKWLYGELQALNAFVKDAVAKRDNLWRLYFWSDFKVYEHPNRDEELFVFDSDRLLVTLTEEGEAALGETTRTEYCQLAVDRDGDVSFVFRPKHDREMSTNCVNVLALYPPDYEEASVMKFSLNDLVLGVVEAWEGADAEDIGNEFFRGQMETIAHLLFAAKWPNARGWMFGDLTDALGEQAKSVIRRMCDQQSGEPLVAHEVFATELMQAWTEHVRCHADGE